MSKKFMHILMLFLVTTSAIQSVYASAQKTENSGELPRGTKINNHLKKHRHLYTAGLVTTENKLNQLAQQLKDLEHQRNEAVVATVPLAL